MIITLCTCTCNDVHHVIVDVHVHGNMYIVQNTYDTQLLLVTSYWSHEILIWYEKYVRCIGIVSVISVLTQA